MDTIERDISEENITAWARLMRVSQQLLSRIERDLKAEGFAPLSWYDALLELGRAGDTGLRPAQLQDAMLLAQYNLSRLLDRLEKAGYVRRERLVEDARGQLIHITDEGSDLLKSMWPSYRRAIARNFADKLAAGEAEILAGILLKLRG